jgi:hypothetical protein
VVARVAVALEGLYNYVHTVDIIEQSFALPGLNRQVEASLTLAQLVGPSFMCAINGSTYLLVGAHRCNAQCA